MTAAAHVNRAAALVAGLNASIQQRGLCGLQHQVKAMVVDGGIEISYRGRWLVTLNPDAFPNVTAVHDHLFSLIRACMFFHLAERAA